MPTVTPMQLGMVGLGRMGANIVRRLLRDGHRCVGTDVGADAVAAAGRGGDDGRGDPAELVAALEPPRTVWVMVPAGEITERAIAELAELLEPGDTIIDGGNTRYHDDIRARGRARRARDPLPRRRDERRGLRARARLLPDGRRRRRGRRAARADLRLARARARRRRANPRREPASRRRRSTAGSTAGRPVPGHFVKMVHNGIEYGADGRVRRRAEHPPPRERRRGRAREGCRDRAARRARALPLRPRRRRDRRAVASRLRRRRRGCSTSPRRRCTSRPTLEGFAGRVSDSGEGRWTSIAAIETGTPAPVLTAALYSRFSSRDEDEFGNRALSAMRKQFGGHHEKPA